MKNDNRIFNNLQRATTPELTAMQDLASRLTSDSSGFSTRHRIDGLKLSSPAANTVKVAQGSALLSNPTSPTGLEPEMIVLALRTSISLAIPTTGVWYRVVASPATAVVTSSGVDIYNPGTQTFAPTVLPVQSINSLAVALVAGTATTYPAAPFGSLTLGFVYDAGPEVVLQDASRWGVDASATPSVQYGTLNASLLENSISISSAGSISWRTHAEFRLGRVSCQIGGLSAASFLSAGLTLVPGTLYHLYMMCPGGELSAAGSFIVGRGVPIISNIAPPTYDRVQTGIVGNSAFPNTVQYPTGTGVYCGSLYFVSGTNWLPWTIEGNRISANASYIPAFQKTDVAGGTFSTTVSATDFSALTSPFVRFRTYNYEVLFQATAPANNLLVTSMSDGVGATYPNRTAATNSAGSASLIREFNSDNRGWSLNLNITSGSSATITATLVGMSF